MGVPITGTLGPTDPTDTFAVTDPLTGIDGLRSVADSAARNAIPTLRRRLGMFVVLQSDLSVWQLNTATNTGTDADWTEFTGGGGGGGSGTVTSIIAGVGLTGGTITTAGTIALANPSATTLGGVESIAAVAHNFLTSISTSGVPAQAQPAFTDISGAILTAQITTANVTYAKIQAIGAVSLLGNPTGSGAAPSEITLGSGLAFSGTTLVAAGSGGTITSLTGDVTGSGTGAVATTLATVNSNVGSFGATTAIPALTINAKGLVTAASTVAVVAPAGTLTGTTMASNVVTSSLTTVGTIGAGTWQGTAITGTYIASSVALAGSPTTTTQTALDDSTKIATTAYVDAAVTAGGGGGITALTGDVTASGTGSVATTLATVNSNTGALGSSTAIPTITTNAKGLVTAVSTNAVIAPAGTLTGTTLASNVLTSSLTTVGTIATGTWHGTAITGTYIASSVALAGSPTTTTQTALDDSTKIATTAYVDAAVTAGGGSGTVNSALSGYVAYYASNGTAVSGEALSTFLDTNWGSTQGDIVYRSSSAWTALAPSTAGYALVTKGSSNNPVWASTGLQIDQHQATVNVPSGTSGTITCNLSLGDWQAPAACTAAFTLALSGTTTGQTFSVFLTQAASGGPYAVTWFSGITWIGAPYTAPTMPATASAVLTAVFRCVSSGVYYGWWLGNSAA